jgi:iron complex transport system substrate-binding protein
MKSRIIIRICIGLICSSSLFAGGQLEKDQVELVNNIAKITFDESDTSWLVENTDSSITIIDNGGNKVTINKPIERIFASGMAVFPAIRALGAEELIIGAQGIDRNEGAILFPYMSKLPVFAPNDPSSLLDYEKIVQMNPDLFIVLADSKAQVDENIGSLGIPVVQLDFGTNKDILILGALLGKKKEAEEYVSWIEEITNNIEDKIQNLTLEDTPSVFLYYGGSYGMAPPPPYGSYGKDNFLGNKMIKMAGGRSITSLTPGEWINVDPEWIIEQNPDVLIREYYNVSGTDNPELGYNANSNSKAKDMVERITLMPAFETSNAVQEKDVHMIYGNIISNSWFLGLPYIAKWLHPDIFYDLDPNEIYQEFITKFMRVYFDLSQQGVLVYSKQ